MSQVLVTRSYIEDIADAIRAKNGSSTKYTPAQMATAISAIPGGSFNWMGDGVECLNANLHNSTVQLSSTTYSTWTASTTAKSLKSTTSLSTFSADMANYAYLLRWVTVAHVALKDTATLNTVPCGLQINLFDQQIMRRPNSLVNIEANNYNGNVYVNSASLGWMQYYSTSGSKTYTWASSYGFYSGVPTPTFASSTASPTSVTPKTPILYTRCSTTYFATDRKNDIDIDNTYWTIHGELYRMDLAKNCMRQRYTDLIDIINDELDAVD